MKSSVIMKNLNPIKIGGFNLQRDSIFDEVDSYVNERWLPKSAMNMVEEDRMLEK